jgi:hypothetical protein
MFTFIGNVSSNLTPSAISPIFPNEIEEIRGFSSKFRFYRIQNITAHNRIFIHGRCQQIVNKLKTGVFQAPDRAQFAGFSPRLFDTCAPGPTKKYLP